MTSNNLQRAESDAVDAIAQLTEAREAFGEAGEDPTEFARTLARIVVECDRAGLDEIPIAQALRAGVAVERLRAEGIGLDHLLELTMISVSVVGRRLDGGEALGRALVLVVTRSYLDAEASENRAQQKALRSLVGISRAVNRTLDPELVAEAGLNETLRAMGLDSGGIWLGSGENLSLVHAHGISEEVRARLLRLDITASPAVQRAAATAAAVRLDVPASDVAFDAYRSALLVPLLGARGNLGILAVGSKRKRRFEESEIDFVTSVSDHLAAALDHALEHRREAHTDYLTGLANRSEFESAVGRELAGARRHRRPLSLMLMDLDDLKKLNDGFGHHAGDEAIRAVAGVIRKAVRTSDISARLGGDEFGIAMPAAGRAQAREVAARIEAGLRAERLEAAPTVGLELSFGVVEWQPGQRQDELFAAGDVLLYRDKRRHQARRARETGASKASSDPTSSPATR
ncbi:MAG TPA: GGDEF domain-containing protein [Candidatus Dormibacteraeota bacterium]|nr:GGDEF domain-containing protein [Candidatus Dormibacteraeota bacterium]